MPAQTSSLYIQKSLELNLFFLRILKEHALFMQLSFTPKNRNLATETEQLKTHLNDLMRQAVQIANGYISRNVLSSGELYTRYTEEAERQTQFFTGAPVDIQLTLAEYNLRSIQMPPASMKPQADRLNQNALSLARQLLNLKERVYSDVQSCRIITNLYPLNINHIIRENRHYIEMLQRMIEGDMDMQSINLGAEEAFWNDIMEEHAEFIAGLLDPTERELKKTAEAFAMEFERLVLQAEAAQRMMQTLPEVTMRSETATENIRDFKAQGTNGILSCSVRSLILPLLSDHVLREANHYLRMLQDATRMTI